MRPNRPHNGMKREAASRRGVSAAAAQHRVRGRPSKVPGCVCFPRLPRQRTASPHAPGTRYGHQSRHWLVLEALYDALKRAYGAAVKKEPTAYRDYSDTRPVADLRNAARERCSAHKALSREVSDALGLSAAAKTGACGRTVRTPRCNRICQAITTRRWQG